jgi:hypothetical protein
MREDAEGRPKITRAIPCVPFPAASITIIFDCGSRPEYGLETCQNEEGNSIAVVVISPGFLKHDGSSG